MTLRAFLMLAGMAVAAALTTSAAVRADDAPKAEAAPIPTLRCEMKTMKACTPDGKCKEDSEVDGMKLPLKVTIDFENGVVAAVDETGFARTDRMDGVVKTQDQLMLHGVDGEFAWQAVISDKTEIASLVMSTADVSLAAFGSCANK